MPIMIQNQKNIVESNHKKKQMEKSTPFKEHGIYIRKINPFEEIIGYKYSRLSQIFRIIYGKENMNYYNVITFFERNGKHTAKYTTEYGEVFDIILETKKNLYSQDKNNLDVLFFGDRIELKNEASQFFGLKHSQDANILYFDLDNRKSDLRDYFLFLPFNVNHYQFHKL